MLATATASHSPSFAGEPSGGGRLGSRSGRGYGGSSEGGQRNRNGRSASRSQEPSVVQEQEPRPRNESMTRENNMMFVRALYNYVTDDPTSLSFNQGDRIQVLKQLDSGWWDGIVHGQRGWFPSNYCALITEPEFINGNANSLLDDSDDLDEDDSYDEYDDEDDDSEHDGLQSPGLPMEGTDEKENDEAAFWIPQATPDGRLYYFNTITGASRSELPLETPTSTTETGPLDRTTVAVAELTRPPADMMAAGYNMAEANNQNIHSQDDDSLSEREGDNVGPKAGYAGIQTQRQSFVSTSSGSETVGSPLSSVDPTSETTLGDNATGPLQLNNAFKPGHSATASIATDATAVNPAPQTYNAMDTGSASYYEEGTPVPRNWDELIERTGLAVERYRQAINNYDRAQYVRRAEDISDMLRLLITGGSATTDNHSGQPSIISQNKTLNPHFRHFMAAFSKLVLSSHVAATDCRPPDAETKCLTEADEVMVGVQGFAETAKAQRGELLPRLKPGFLQGSHAASGWKLTPTNDLGTPASPKTAVAEVDAKVPMDTALVETMEGLNNSVIKPALKGLESSLGNIEKVTSPLQQAALANRVLEKTQIVFGAVRGYLQLLENIKMLPLTQTSQSPTLIDFVISKQRLHDSFADMFLACQAVTSPLTDEWAAVREEPLEDRLNSIQIYIKEVESGIRSLEFSIQLLAEENQQPENPIQTYWPNGTSNGITASEVPGPHPGQPSDILGPRGQGTPPTKAQLATKPTPPTPAPTGPSSGEVPSYLQSDHENEIIYAAKGQVKGGTLVALVEKLTHHDALNSNFNSTFLLTYPSFTNAVELFNQLVRRFTIQPPPGISSAEYQDWVDKKQKLIRMRVLSVTKMWVEAFWMEDNNDKSKELLRKMFTFAKEVMLPQLQGTSQVLTSIETRMRGQEPENKRLILTHAVQLPSPVLPRNLKRLKFLDIDPLEFARQLTMLESKSYGKLRAQECLSKGWSKQPNGGPDPAENIRAIIMQSNQMTNWVTEMILGQNEPRKRVMVIKHFVTIADKCRTLNNFSTLTAILAALQTSAIHRLRRTWEHVQPRTMAVLDGMNQLMGASMNFAVYREMLHQVNPPCVPFLGVYLKDLTFVADGNDDFIKGTELINYGKRVKTANIIQEIQQYQAVPYPLQVVPELQDYIISNMTSARDVAEMYNVSLNLEPKEREEEKIARLLQESGFL